jgi:hypothetical protein
MAISSISNLFKNKEEAKKVLSKSSFVPMSCLVVAADTLTNGAAFVWEIETLFEYLEDKGCLPSAAARDRLIAGIACLNNPSFLWDANVLKCLCQTINGEIALPDHWEPLTAANVTYAVKEINALFSLYENAKDLTPLYAEDSKIFIAGCCAHSGFARIPSDLSFCATQFERFFSEPEDPLESSINEVQITKHEEVGLYCTVMGKIRDNNLEALK